MQSYSTVCLLSSHFVSFNGASRKKAGYLLPRGMPLSHGTRVWQRPQPVAVTP